MISRHPAAIEWLKGKFILRYFTKYRCNKNVFPAHNFYLCKMNIQQIRVLDFYGGPHIVPVDDYYNVKFSKLDFHKKKSHHKKYQLKFNLNDFS